MEQKDMVAFEAYCLKTLIQAIAATENDTEKTLMQLLRDYSIYDCIETFAY
jgi:hypothetical protein